jgi:hypothetical protein
MSASLFHKTFCKPDLCNQNINQVVSCAQAGTRRNLDEAYFATSSKSANLHYFWNAIVHFNAGSSHNGVTGTTALTVG